MFADDGGLRYAREPANHAAASYAPIAALPATTASDMKRQGWRGVMAAVRREGHLLITNHNVPEAVILPPEQYDQLVSAARRGLAAPDPELAALRLRFRERMQCLLAPGANEKLAALMSGPMTLDGQVIAGASH